MNKGIVVIGGGAGGMMAAICAARKGASVTLLDPNERLGKKVNITGKGRCNVTNESSCEELLAHVPQNPRFLYSAFSRFDGHAAIDFFEGLGVPLKVERGKRVFPVSDRSFNITAALERELKRLRVKLVRDRALDVSLEDGHVAAVRGELSRRCRCFGDGRCIVFRNRFNGRRFSHGGVSRPHGHAAARLTRAA